MPFPRSRTSRRPPPVPRILSAIIASLLVPFAAAQLIIAAPSLTSFNLSSSLGTFFTLPTSVTPIYITLNLCSAPVTNASTLPLVLDDIFFVSNSSTRAEPSPFDRPPKTAGGSFGLKGGFGNATLGSALDGGASVGVWAPAGLEADQWLFQLGVSMDAPIHNVNAFPAFKYEDSDASSVLLTAADSSLFIPLDTIEAPSLQTRFPIIAPTLATIPYGLSASLCAVQMLNTTARANSLITTENVSVSLTARGSGADTSSSTAGSGNDFRLSAAEAGIRAQYEVEGLQRGTNYTVWMFEPAGQVGGVTTGKLWPAVWFKTKSTDSCKLMHSLPFCPSIAHAVPAPLNLPLPILLDHYNATVAPHLSNFRTTLSTYPCDNADVDGSWSFVATCDDCYRAYEGWACAVLMPRCTDMPDEVVTPEAFVTFPPTAQTVLARITANLSRTPQFGEDNLTNTFQGVGLPAGTSLTTPFPYGETPPCHGLCTMLAAVCPPFLGFSCPIPGITAFSSYGMVQTISGDLVQGGEEGGAGNGGLRSADRFGNVLCEAGEAIMGYARMGGAGRARVGSVLGTVGMLWALVMVLGWF